MSNRKHLLDDRAVPKLLRQVREKAKLTQRDLALRLRRGQPWIHKSEMGVRRIDVAEFVDWCIACEVRPEKAFQTLLQGRK